MIKIPTKQDSAAVFGLGRSGSATLRWLLERGVRATAYDDDPRARELLFAEGLGDVPFFSRENYLFMPRADFLFRAPAMRPDHPILAHFISRGGLLTDEISLFAALSAAKILAVTGSDGKSTTATLAYEALRLAGHRAYLGGNIGRSLLPQVSAMREGDFAVLELSSFQLMTADIKACRGVITNLSPNHLNWHKDMAEYTAAKASLFDKCEEMTVRDGLFPEREARRFSLDAKTPLRLENGTLFDGDAPLFKAADMRLLGRFHLENFLAAAGLLHGLVPPSVFSHLALTFSGLKNRLEWVGYRLGRDFYNSSIDTSPLRTLQSLSALKEKGISPIVLLGGADKGLSLLPLREELPRLARAAVLFGKSRARLKDALFGRLPLAEAENLEEAVSAALVLDKEGTAAVVLSPAMTAFDAFRDYEARGEAFREIVEKLPK